jgi:hypothetical protein
VSEYEHSPTDGKKTKREETVEDLDVPECQDEDVTGVVIDFKEIDSQ